MAGFDVSEILQFAVRIEENGEKAYRSLAGKLKNAKAKDLFIYLADEEVKHKETFSKILSVIERYEPAESYPGEYFAYLRAYADNIIFSEKSLQEEVRKVKSVASAFEFGIQRELESILYYLEMRNLVPESQRDVIMKIVDEERKHYVKFSDAKKNL